MNPSPLAPPRSESETERLCFSGQAFSVPKALITEEEVFMNVVTKESWNTLSSENRESLKKLLPSHQTEEETECLIDSIFDVKANHFHFNHPVRESYRRLKADWYRADRPSRELQIRDNVRLLYDHAIRKYYIQLLKKLLASRRKILEIAAGTPQGEVPSFPSLSSTVNKSGTNRRERIRKRAAKRSRLMIQECKQEIGETGLSSDEEEDAQSKHAITVSSAGECTILVPCSSDLRIHQPLELDDLKVMLHEYRSLKKVMPDHPVLELTDISLEDVIERAGMDAMAERVGLPVKHPTVSIKQEPSHNGAPAKSGGSKKGGKVGAAVPVNVPASHPPPPQPHPASSIPSI